MSEIKKNRSFRVLKFGGTSVGSPERIKNLVNIIQKSRAGISHETPHYIILVVSAFSGVTDQLIELGKSASLGSEDYKISFKALKERHAQAIGALISDRNLLEVQKTVDAILLELENILEGVYLVKELSPKTLDHIMSFGERLSAYIVVQTIKQQLPEAVYIDARDWIKTDKTYGKAQVHFEKTYEIIKRDIEKVSTLCVLPGFIASSYDNETTTLGRGGSDYTAAIIGAALDASCVEIWTDVSGVMTADPRKEPYAFPIPEMSYKEAMELTYFGAKVIHPPTVIPAFDKKIPLLVKNSFHPEDAGTLISSQPQINGRLISGISSIEEVALLSLQGNGMVGVAGIARRFFGALAEKGISIILISQGSSEHSICVAMAPGFADLAKEAVSKEFHFEIQAKLIDEIILERNLSVIALVGRNMRKNTGIAGKFFDTLGKNGVNIVAIAQGSSELNISIVVKREDETKAIRVVHEAFFLSKRKTLNVYLVGLGLIGGTLLDQIQKHHARLHEDHALDLRIVGLANSRLMAFNPEGFKIETLRQELERTGRKMDMNSFMDKMLESNLINSVFVDCTSSQELSEQYEKILLGNISIVTPNKKANSSSFSFYKKLREAVYKKGSKFFYGANAGAGLPVLSTIHELVRSGDKIQSMETILSGTMSFLFNSFNEGVSFYELVKEAQKKGYTEPDPREDLNGMDLARKLLILARESAYPIELKDIYIEKVLPEDCFQTGSVEEFYEKLKVKSKDLENKRDEAKKQGKVLRYVAKFENGRGVVSLQAVDVDHPFYHLKGNDNIVCLKSDFYKENPLIIRGPGAGSEVTAGKVFADIIRLGLD